MSRGSEWGRWDLHVHTKGTAKNDQFGNISFDEYCIQLFKKALERNIKAIGITDYFSIENYKKVKDFQDKISFRTEFNHEEKILISKILLLPNMELRISPSTGSGTLINLHFIFNPLKINDFENLILNQIQMKYGDGRKFPLTRYGLTELGKLSLTSEQQDDNDLAYKKGIEQFCVPHSQLIEVFESHKNIKNELLIFVTNGDGDGVSGLRSHEEILADHQASVASLRNSIYQLADGLFSPKPSDYKYFLGKGNEKAEQIISKYRSLKPCIHGSDAHQLEELFEPKLNRYCWIKAEPTFEGLKQIIHEPESRIHIGQHCPELKNQYEVIDYIELNNIHVANEKIYFNSNLTSIIGGRSSGKSTLLQCLANKLKPTALSEFEKSQHIQDLCSNFKIVWKDGKEDYSRPIEYFYQGHMYTKSKNEGIENIVKNLIHQKDTRLFTNFKEQNDFLRHEISGKVSTYFSLLNSLNTYQSLLTEKGNKYDIQKQIDDLFKQIKSYQVDTISHDELTYFNTSTNTLSILENYLESISQFQTLIDEKNINDYLKIINPFENNGHFNLIQSNFDDFQTRLSNFATTEFEVFKINYQQILKNKILEISTEINQINSNDTFAKVKTYLRSSNAIKPLLDRLNSEKNKIREIDDYLKKIEDLKIESDELKFEFQNTIWLSMSDITSNLIKDISELTISQDLNIQAKSIFDKFSFDEFIRKTINQQSEKARSYTEIQVSTQHELLKNYFDILKSVNNGTIRFKQGTNLELFTKEFFDQSWFKIVFDVIYDGDNYNEMSQGKKAFVVLKMTLDCSDSKCPIIIDQPEDDLDNRAIYKELVAFLKEKKKERQIILVTHNANVVVNADSELIVIANQHGSHAPNANNAKFQYKFGSIESLEHNPDCPSTLNQKTIKTHICEILEGGDRAFKLREQKYNLAS